MSNIPYTTGGNTRPYSPPFAIRFKAHLPKFGITSGEEASSYIVKMAKSNKIMLFPPDGQKNFYIVLEGERAVQELIDFIDLPEYNLQSWNPPVDSGADVEFPY